MLAFQYSFFVCLAPKCLQQLKSKEDCGYNATTCYFARNISSAASKLRTVELERTFHTKNTQQSLLSDVINAPKLIVSYNNVLAVFLCSVQQFTVCTYRKRSTPTETLLNNTQIRACQLYVAINLVTTRV